MVSAPSKINGTWKIDPAGHGRIQKERRRPRQKGWIGTIKDQLGLSFGEAFIKLKPNKDGEKWSSDHPWCPNVI